ncbi:MAG: MBL fold metallo-hydrolase [Candidatus Dadabacteria bacterium]
MRTLLLAFIMLLTGLAATSFKTIPGSKHFTIIKLAPGVWTAINNDKYGHAICNAGIIDLGDKAIIFDPFMNIDAAKDLKFIAGILTGKEATIVVNSHFHNDHIRGNQVFLPATIISTEWTRNKIAVSEPNELAWENANASKILMDYKQKLAKARGREREELPIWIGYYEGMLLSSPLVKTTLPSFTFADSLWIHGSIRSVKLVECKGGHTLSDLVLEIPSDGIIFMGDLLSQQRHPYLADGKWKSWITHLQNFYNNPSYKKFVPGHGEVSGKSELKTMMEYINQLHSLVEAQVNSGKPDSVIRQLPMPSVYNRWKFAHFYSENIEFLIKEVRREDNRLAH